MEATIETEQLMCIILEYVEGGELFEFVQKMHQQLRMSQNSKIDETLVKPIFLQLVQAVKWLHGHNIVHRDLKLESKYPLPFILKTHTNALNNRYSYS